MKARTSCWAGGAIVFYFFCCHKLVRVRVAQGCGKALWHSMTCEEGCILISDWSPDNWKVRSTHRAAATQLWMIWMSSYGLLRRTTSDIGERRPQMASISPLGSCRATIGHLELNCRSVGCIYREVRSHDILCVRL